MPSVPGQNPKDAAAGAPMRRQRHRSVGAALAAVALLTPLRPATAAPSLGKAHILDLRIEASGAGTLVRILRADLDRLAYAQALGEPLFSVAGAMSIREDVYPPRVMRGLAPDIARRAAGLWLLVRERGWTDSSGIEWDPGLVSTGRNTDASSAGQASLRDAPADSRAGKLGVWPAPERGSPPLRASPRFGVSCVDRHASPTRCFRVWN